MPIWRLRVDGHPAPKGSLKCVGHGGRHQLIEDDANKTRSAWRSKLTAAATALADRLPNQGDDGVIIGVLVLLNRPAAAATRPLPGRRSAGDVDKHLRMTLDALDDAGLYADDSRVCLTLAAKAYTDDGRPGAVVYVAPIGEDPHRILTAMLTAAPALTGTPTLI